jgi:ATP-binding cassette subfamily B protein
VHRGWTAVLVTAQVLAGAVALLTPGAVAAVVDAIEAAASAAGPLALVVALLVGGLAAETTASAATALHAAGVTARLRGRLLGHVLAGGPALLRRFSGGELVSRATLDATGPGGLVPALTGAATGVLIGAGGLTGLFLTDWRIGLAFLMALPAVLVLLRRFYGDTTDIVKRYRAAQAELSQRLVDAAEGARTVAATGTLDRELDRVLAPVDDLARIGADQWHAQRRLGSRVGLLVVAMQVVVLATAGLSLTAGRIDAGQLVAALGYLGLALGALDSLEVLASAARVRAESDRLRDVVATPLPRTGQRVLPPAPLDLVLESVSVVDGDTVVLDDISLTVPHGQQVALVGRSGAGTSTVAALVGRLARPTSGRVLLAGADVAGLDEAELRRTVGYAFARPAPLGATLADLVALGAPGADVPAAARLAAADGFVPHLPDGWATPPRATPLSGGEWQRLGIAQAIARDPGVLVLDDATSNLDTATEARVLAALEDAAAGRTALVVTHRAPVAARADVVVWLEAGRVRATGRHADLLAEPGYRALFAGEDHSPAAPPADPPAVLAGAAPGGAR